MKIVALLTHFVELYQLYGDVEVRAIDEKAQEVQVADVEFCDVSGKVYIKLEGS